VLVGDACHAVYSFLAQGMNVAFEDCFGLSGGSCPGVLRGSAPGHEMRGFI
jgi:hypothetical protein